MIRDLDVALRTHADSLQIASDAVRDAADLLQAGASTAAIASTLNLAALNSVSTALGLARRVGQLEANATANDNDGGPQS